jgi:hypothetical protein
MFGSGGKKRAHRRRQTAPWWNKRLGIEARVKCQNDIFITDTWSLSISVGKAARSGE